MYIEDKKPIQKYKRKRYRNPKVTLTINLLLIFLFSLFAGLIVVEVSNIDFPTNYMVLGESTVAGKRQELVIEQENNSGQFYDDEFFRGENLSVKDKRTFVLERYFSANNSPLAGHAQDFVDACEKFGAPNDCLVVVAIAKNESNLCKYYMSAEMRNCWGYGGPGIHRWTFDSFKEGIYQVTDILVNKYGIEYMVDPRKMQRTFCGANPSCETWGGKILTIMDSIDAYAESLGVGKLRTQL
jgi:hypothetical protein